MYITTSKAGPQFTFRQAEKTWLSWAQRWAFKCWHGTLPCRKFQTGLSSSSLSLQWVSSLSSCHFLTIYLVILLFFLKRDKRTQWTHKTKLKYQKQQKRGGIVIFCGTVKKKTIDQRQHQQSAAWFLCVNAARPPPILISLAPSALTSLVISAWSLPFLLCSSICPFLHSAVWEMMLEG